MNHTGKPDIFPYLPSVNNVRVVPVLCQSCHFDRLWRWWRTQSLTKQVKNQELLTSYPHENTELLLDPIIFSAPIICVPLLHLLLSVTGSACRDEESGGDT